MNQGASQHRGELLQHSDDGEDLQNHAGYVGEWLKTMQGDSSFIFKAAIQASKVTDYLLGLVPEKVEEAAVV